MDAINKEKFGEFIARLRKEKGLTQQELADRLFLSNKAVSKWERGQSLPDIDLLTPLSDILGVSVAELLKGERLSGEAMDSGEVETLVSQALRLSGAEEEKKRGRTRKRWKTLWVRSLVVSLLEAGFLIWQGETWESLGSSVFLVQLLCLLFGLWTCFFIKETLPAYYDENKIDYYTDGVFRLHIAGLRLNNSNWPHIVHALRVWTVGMPVLFPVVYWLLRSWWNQSLALSLGTTLAACLGLFAPVVVVGKKYE